MVDGYSENDIARILDDIVNTASSPESAVSVMLTSSASEVGHF